MSLIQGSPTAQLQGSQLDDRAALEALVVAVTKLMPWETRLPFVPTEQRAAHRAWCAALAHLGMTERDVHAAAKVLLETEKAAERAKGW